MTVDAIAKECGLSRTTVIAVYKAYKEGGWAAVKLKRRGRPKRSGRAMPQSQEAEILRLMREKSPEHLSLPGYLWTSTAVKKLVLDSCGLEMTDRAIRNYLERWGLAKNRFSNKDLARMNERQQIWFETKYPNVKAKAYLQGFSIYFLNLVVLGAGALIEVSKQPAHSVPAVRQVKQWILLRALSSQGHISWKIYAGGFTTTVLKDFCDRLCRDTESKTLVILEPSRQAGSVRLQTWLYSRKERIRFEFLPGALDSKPEGQ